MSESENPITLENTQPNQMMHTIQVMTVSSIERIGTFLTTGQDKELLLPRSEQFGELSPGDKVVVYIKEDKELRPMATEKFEKILNKLNEKFAPEQAVDLIIYDETELGYKAVINQKATGILYKNEVFQKLFYGQSIQGFIKKQRDDGKIDLILRAAGHKATEDIAVKILELLEDHNGFYNLNDKTPSEEIHRLFGVSKKKFKIALGGLYKQRLITVDDSGVTLIKS
jgi:predicted RNA-binding protein (virulence factor B family)